MKIEELQENWNRFGETDPLWAIASDPALKNGKWDIAAFFESGKAHVAHLMSQLDGLGLPLVRGKCLDFGCGVGRLTQAFCDYFQECHGVDIAPSMIELAKRYNRHGDRCHYYVNTVDNLSLFANATFDFVHSCLVLQHMQPEYSKHYIGEFMRVVKPGGLVVFQIPEERLPMPDAYRLPDSAFKAQITLVDQLATLRPGAKITAQVRVKNLSDVAWPAQVPSDGALQIRLGNHWLDPGGNVVTFDDGRAALPVDLMPQQEAVIPLELTAPATPGSYILELDLVQELAAWFNDRGSQTLRVPVRVAEGLVARLYQIIGVRRPQPAAPRETAPVFEMYGVKREEISELIQHAGARLIKVQEDRFAGHDWSSFTYYVTR